MPDSIADGQGQVPPVPQSPDSNGQVPPVSQVQSADHGDHSDGTPEQDMTPAEYRDALKRANAQAAKYRVDSKELAELRAFKQQQDDAKLSTDEKRDRALAEAQQRAADAEIRAQGIAIRAEIKSVATVMGIKPELATKLLDHNAIEFNEDGDPTNVAELLAKVVAELLPDLAQQQQQQQTPTPQQPLAPAMSATNPSRASQLVGANGHFSKNDLHIKVTDPALWKK